MRRRLFISLAITLVGVIGVTLWWNNRFAGPQVIIGPHKANVRFISFAEAHQKPWMNISPFGLGPFIFPKPMNFPRSDSDDPRFVVGYIAVVNGGALRWDAPVNKLSAAYGRITDGYIAVDFPATQNNEKRTLYEGQEPIEVLVPFDPTRLGTRYEPLAFEAGPWQLTAKFKSFMGGMALVNLQFVSEYPPNSVGYEYRCLNSRGRGRQRAPEEGFSVFGEILPSGEVRVTGSFADSITRWAMRYPMNFTIKPRPLVGGKK